MRPPKRMAETWPDVSGTTHLLVDQGSGQVDRRHCPSLACCPCLSSRSRFTACCLASCLGIARPAAGLGCASCLHRRCQLGLCHGRTLCLKAAAPAENVCVAVPQRPPSCSWLSRGRTAARADKNAGTWQPSEEHEHLRSRAQLGLMRTACSSWRHPLAPMGLCVKVRRCSLGLLRMASANTAAAPLHLPDQGACSSSTYLLRVQLQARRSFKPPSLLRRDPWAKTVLEGTSSTHSSAQIMKVPTTTAGCPIDPLPAGPRCAALRLPPAGRWPLPGCSRTGTGAAHHHSPAGRPRCPGHLLLPAGSTPTAGSAAQHSSAGQPWTTCQSQAVARTPESNPDCRTAAWLHSRAAQPGLTLQGLHRGQHAACCRMSCSRDPLDHRCDCTDAELTPRALRRWEAAPAVRPQRLRSRRRRGTRPASTPQMAATPASPMPAEGDPCQRCPHKLPAAGD